MLTVFTNTDNNSGGIFDSVDGVKWKKGNEHLHPNNGAIYIFKAYRYSKKK